MSIPFNIGVLQLSMEPVHETAAMAKACEDAGFDTFWIAEAYPWWRKHAFEARSSTAILAVIASQTKRIHLGWGIISPYTRHPVQIAMEARVMQDLAGDRFLLGLGASKIFMKEIGEGEGEKVGPATVMRESIEIIRGVLKGDAFEYQGKVFVASVPPLKSDAHTSRKIPPVYVAGTGPAMQKLGGSLGDGLLTASITTPAFVRYSKKNMEEGAAKAGKRRLETDPRLRDRRQHRPRFKEREKKAHANKPPCISPTKYRTSKAQPTCCSNPRASPLTSFNP